jgi:CubicO group peptidase (beta-lactamase class C family)
MSRSDFLKALLALLLFSHLSVFSCQRNDNNSLSPSAPENVGMSSEHLSLVRGLIQEAIERRDIPGAVVLVARKGKIVMHEAFGESQWIPDRRPMDVSMLFDVASLTKPIATAVSIMILVEQGNVRLWDRVKEYVPGFIPYIGKNGDPAEDIRIWHLLTHTSGLPPVADADVLEKNFGHAVSLSAIVEHISHLKKNFPPGKDFEYSDLGFILLAHIVEIVSDQTLAEFSHEYIFGPLGMENTLFTPSEEMRHHCVPTEVIDGNPLIGVVHDPRARLLGGVAGHAGLFSTAEDLAVFAQMMLNRGEFRGVRILSPLAVERMTSVFPEAGFSGRGLGWDLDSSYSTCGGDIFGPHSYGHSGYTGCSVWIDPETQTSVILLTNRVHPDDRGDVLALRSKVANVVASSIGR